MKLNELSDKPGATKRRKRVGRGPGSGLGKTGGRGIKGQTSRSGVAIKGFEGGQMPIHRRLPKRGFNSLNRKVYAVVNVGQLQGAVDRGAIDAGAEINEAMLVEAGVLRRAKTYGLRVLGKGELKAALKIAAATASEGAKKAIEGAGGSLTLSPKVVAPATDDA